MLPPSLQSVLQAASHGRHWTLEVGDMRLQSNGPADTDDMLRAFPDLAEQVRHRAMAPSASRPAQPRPVAPAPPPVDPVMEPLPKSREAGEVPAVSACPTPAVVDPATDEPAPDARPSAPTTGEAPARVTPVAALKAPAVFVPAGEVPENAPSASDLETLAAWHMEKYARRKTDPDTVSCIQRTLKLFLAVIGNKEARDVDYRDLQRFANALSRWPKFVNNIKELKDKSIPEILDENIDGKYPTLERSSQETHLQHLSAFFNQIIRWQCNGGLPNPVLTINRTKEYGSQDSHTKQAPDEVEWAAPMSREVMDSVDAPHKFFGELLVAHTGARTNEICQLKRNDVRYVTVADRKRVSHRLLCIDIRTRDEDQHLKSKYSNRLIPVPRRVLEAGFEDYLLDLDQLGATEIFPGLQTARKRPGQSLSKYHNGKLRSEWGVPDKSITLHCNRHFISTMAAYNNFPHFLVTALFGQSNKPVEGTTRGEALRLKKYIDKVSPLDLQNMLDELPFPELDFTPYQRGRFDHYLCHEVGRMKAGQKRKGRVPRAKTAPPPNANPVVAEDAAVA
ncbi:MAG: hypothetical protein AAGC76_02000 [Luteibacter sp.]|uniref:hypothetical protein n=1 Tax=Luteibacter sp. TaxID=1886636 RepID=UPI002809DF3F|nr:hypothetical protein [Luteibacter sp.]MDQ7994606.1 hypothetical protein [Luteibacter sp.]